MTTAPRPGELNRPYTITYDAWNRLVEIKAGDNVVVKKEYDGLNRRVKQHINPDYNDNTYDQFCHFYYDNNWPALDARPRSCCMSL